MGTRLIYLLLFMAPQGLLYLYLRERLPGAAPPRRAHLVRATLAAVFVVFNLPWLAVAHRVLFDTVWGVGWIPFTGPFVAWQLLGWGFTGLVVLYVAFKGVLWVVGRVEQRHAGKTDRLITLELSRDPAVQLSRRRFLARATYGYAALGAAVATHGIWSAYRLPQLTRRTLRFPDLPLGLDGLTILHLSDLHAGIHLGEDLMQELVAQANALRPELIVQTGDMIDISPSYIAPYVRAFRDLHAPLGIVTVLGNHDRYTGEQAVIRGCRDAGQVFLQNGCHVLERAGATLALLGIDDPHNWTADDPQPADVAAARRRAPPEAFHVLLAHRPGAWDSAAPQGIPLTLAGHIHGGQLYLPVVGWSAGRLITKYVMGHFQRGASQLYVSRGIGVVGVPIRIFTPPEIELFTLRRASPG
ncbi:MAG TPA: metallophosphoesterase [Gemmatimonadales bacterium]|nr:metallophosphoesterase [Gemmatimonadales bacterium]